MILTGRRITATEGLGYGLVNRVTDAGKALDGARADAFDELMASEDAIEGVTAFAQKRRPVWRNR